MLPDHRPKKNEPANQNDDQKSGYTGPSPALFDVYNITADQDFISSLAEGILGEVGDDILSLSDYTIILPTRKNAQALREAFVELSKGTSAILPNIFTPRDFDDEVASLKIAQDPILSEALMDLPPAISPLQRKLLLAKEILSVPGMASSPEKAIRLGEELGRFLDFTQKYGVELKNLESLAPEEFSEQWDKTRNFLKILTERWPEILAEHGMIDPQDHKNAVTGIQAAHWKHTPPEKPVVMAGFTHASLAELDLLSAVASLDRGSIVFPGVDRHLDDESWETMDEAHPQFGIKEILEYLPMNRDDIKEWEAEPTHSAHTRSNNVKATVEARHKLLSETMRPSSTADKWLKLEQAPAPSKRKRKTPVKKTAKKKDDHLIDVRALTGMDLATCSTPQQEASIIALKMRETLETEGRTAALVTPDRSLARRVAARLRHWGIEVQDSVDRSLADTKTGVWMRLTAAMAADELSPITLLSTLKHPYSTLGQERKDIERNVQQLEDYLLHGPRPEPGIDGLEKRLQQAFNPRAAKADLKDRPTSARDEKRQEELEEIQNWLVKLKEMSHPFLDAMKSDEKVPFAELLDKHIEFAEAMANETEVQGTAKLWTGRAGKKSMHFFTELRKYADSMPPVNGEEYVGVVSTLMRSINIKPKPPSHSALQILSPKEARLCKADTMIVSGLNENVWPSAPPEINWLSRDMLKKLGLPSSDLHMGKAANDFIQLTSSTDVLLTRAERNGDVPSVSSPFLTRLRMVLGKTDLTEHLESKSQLASINEALNKPSQIKPIAPPAPKPPKDARPKQLSATAIETLLRDPYSLYARHILKLNPRETLDSEPSARERGNFIHEILENFVLKYPDEMPKNAYDELIDMGKEVFNERLDNPTVRAFWWPRFEYVAQWFVNEENERRDFARTIGTEVPGRLDIETKNGKFTLTAIADRIDRLSDDKLSIIDYKTGTVPTKSAVTRGFSPQLTLEALIALAGGFKGIDASDVGSLEYWKLSGGQPAGKIMPINENINKLEQEALEGLTDLMETFLDEDTPFLPTPRPRLAPRFNNYAHLSRADEWKYEERKEKKKARAKRKTAVKKKAPAKKKATTKKTTTKKAPAKKAPAKKAPAKKKTTTTRRRKSGPSK